jgi:AraC-like DNA-binding protein
MGRFRPMGIRFFRPREELRDVVDRIYVHEGGDAALASARWLIVPDGEIKLIFPYRGDIRCTIGDSERTHAASRLVVSGMRTEPGTLSFPTGVAAIGLVLKPESAHRVLAVPMHEIANRSLSADDVFGNASRRWEERLIELGREEDRIDWIQTIVRDLIRRRDRRDPLVEHAARRLREREGSVRIAELARELGWSRRQLDRKFRERIGIGPKSLASVLRFHGAYKRLRAVAAGARYDRFLYERYYDQAHFLKDFTRYTGGPPRAYRTANDYGRFYVLE